MPTTVSGSIKSLLTTGVGSSTNAFVRFVLSGTQGNQPAVVGTGAIAPLQSANGQFYCDVAADANGALSGTIYSTRDATGALGGDISVGGSTTAVYYTMLIYNNGVAGPGTKIHAKNGATLDPSSVTPITTPPVVSAPTGDGTYLRLTGDTVTGLTTFAAGQVTKKLNGIRFADQFSGATADVRIASAIADLPTGGTVNCYGFGATTQSIAAQITVPSDITLLFDPSTKFQPATSGLNVFLFKPRSVIRGFTFNCANQPSYSGIVFQNDNTLAYNDGGDNSLNTEIGFIHFDSSCASLTTGTALKLSSSSASTGVAFLNIHDWRVNGLNDGVFITTTGSGGFVNGNHFTNMVWQQTQHGVHITGANSATSVTGNLFYSCSYEQGGSGVNGLLIDGSTTTIEANQWIGNIWDTTAPIVISHTGARNNHIIGRIDGTPSDNASLLNTFLDMRNGGNGYIDSDAWKHQNTHTFTKTLFANRIRANQGTAYSGADPAITLSAGWGTTRTVSGATGYDQAFSFTVNATGTGQAANPTIQIIFKDGTWTSTPQFICKRNDAVSPVEGSAPTTWAVNATSLTITFNGTPVAGSNYNFTCFAMGN